MMQRPVLVDPDQLPERSVAFALELLDPVSVTLISEGVEVAIAGRDAKPIVNLSGRFVWLGQTDVWPTTLSVTPGAQPFEPIRDLDVTGQRPAQWPNVLPQQRIVRVRLKPTPTYPFEDGITAIRGFLFEAGPAANQRRPIEGAQVWFEWAIKGAPDWQPIDPIRRVRTNARGEFAVFDRVRGSLAREPDVDKGQLKVRVVVARDGDEKRTPADFQFLPAPADAQRVPEGIALANPVALAWGALSPP